MLKVGEKALDFDLPDQDGKLHSLSTYKGQYVLVYFYPKDDTPGCTKEACALRDEYALFEKNGIKVFGISADSKKSHKKFVEKYKLPFTLLSDPEKEVITVYGAGGAIGTKRISYLINKKGIIEKVYQKVDPPSHAKQILDDWFNLTKETL